jgi:hypothetical protein
MLKRILFVAVLSLLMPLSAIADVVLFGQIESVNDPLQGPRVV